MVTRFSAVLAVACVLSGVASASAAQEIQPQSGVLMTGKIRFPRAQEMSVQTDPRNGSRMTAFLGFHGKCTGGGFSALWASNVATTRSIRVVDGKFAVTLTGTERKLGGAAGRTGKFRWRFVGRFVAPNVITATVSGSGEIRVRGETISTCRIASPAKVRLTVRA